MSRVDLHLHSTASDGEAAPEQVVSRAAIVGLHTIALTDHDTLEGIPAAQRAGTLLGVRVLSGCEFSVSVRWGEMHLLAYGLPTDDDGLSTFLGEQRRRRAARAEAIVERLEQAGVALELNDVRHQANGAAIGRPHVARALVAGGFVADLKSAFDRYLARGCPAFVAKDLPDLRSVTELVARVGGVTSAAHLGSRATRATLSALRDAGVDGVEARHPSHDPVRAAKIERIGTDVGMTLTGGSDWHGDGTRHHGGTGIGGVSVPDEWLHALEHRMTIRTAELNA